MKWRLILMLLAAFLSAGTLTATTGCESEGPAENAGEKLDEAADNVGDEMDEAAGDVEDAVE